MEKAQKVINTTSLKELIKKELDIFDSIYYHDGRFDLKTAAELNNTTGKVLNVVRVQLETAKYLKEKPKRENMFLLSK